MDKTIPEIVDTTRRLVVFGNPIYHHLSRATLLCIVSILYNCCLECGHCNLLQALTIILTNWMWEVARNKRSFSRNICLIFNIEQHRRVTTLLVNAQEWKWGWPHMRCNASLTLKALWGVFAPSVMCVWISNGDPVSPTFNSYLQMIICVTIGYWQIAKQCTWMWHNSKHKRHTFLQLQDSPV